MRYAADVLSPTARDHTRRPAVIDVPAELGLVVEDAESGWVGAVVRVEKSGGMHVVHLEDRHGRTRGFRLGPGFWVEGRPVALTPPAPVAARGIDGRHHAPGGPNGLALDGRAGSAVAPGNGYQPARTASGSVAVPGSKARIARGSRIWVEGKHDAELIERVWGDDLRIEGVVVEMLDGVDNLADALLEFSPDPERRVGVLVDHLVPGSKEQRIAEAVTAEHPTGTVLVLGHPYVDVWQAVRPERIGLRTWPTVERGIEWKRGILAELGWPHATQADVAQAWRRILGSVRDYRDLDAALLGRVEELIDFVTVG